MTLETCVVRQAGVLSRDSSSLECCLIHQNISELFHLDHTLGYRMGPIPSLQAVFQGSGGHLQLGD